MSPAAFAVTVMLPPPKVALMSPVAEEEVDAEADTLDAVPAMPPALTEAPLSAVMSIVLPARQLAMRVMLSPAMPPAFTELFAVTSSTESAKHCERLPPEALPTMPPAHTLDAVAVRVNVFTPLFVASRAFALPAMPPAKTSDAEPTDTVTLSAKTFVRVDAVSPARAAAPPA